jgi:hypothetical protein
MYDLVHRVRGFAAWVAIIAVALNALWPLIAQLQPGEAATLMESRAVGGVLQDALEHHGHHDSAPDEPSPLTPHCGFCSLAPGGFSVLVADRFDAAPLIIDTEEFRPALPEGRAPAFFSYSPAHPRAPPVLS